MFDAPVDAWYVWIGVALASLTVAGVAVQLPSEAPPDAAAAADTVDAVAASDHAATAEHPLSADEVRVGPHRIALDGGAGKSHADFAFGPITPVRDGRLRRVLRGVPPATVFDSPSSFRQATARARNRTPRWRSTGETLLVRKVTWEETNVTLVG